MVFSARAVPRLWNLTRVSPVLIQSFNRPILQAVGIPNNCRYGSKKKRLAKAAHKAAQKAQRAGLPAPEQRLDVKIIVQQRERLAAKAKLKRLEAKKEAKLRLEARDAKKSPTFMNIETALRYIRSAEAGHRPDKTTICLKMRIVAEKGATPVNGNCRLPRPVVKSERIGVFTDTAHLAEEARQAGAAVVGGDELIEKVRQGEINFDRTFASPEMEKRLLSIAKILGPKGLMPSSKRGTVTEELGEAVKTALGETSYKQQGDMLKLSIAQASFSDLEIVKNIVTVVDSIRAQIRRSENSKHAYIGKATISTYRCPEIVIQV